MHHNAPKGFAADLPPEWQLLALCGRQSLSAPEQARVSELLHSSLDFDALRRQLRKHRIWPIVYQNLKTTDLKTLNPPFWMELEAMYRSNQAFSMRNFGETVRLMRALEAQQIPVLSLKGPVLSQTLYGDLSLRMSRDIDLLVSPASLEQAEAILCREGYRPHGGLANPTPRQRAMLLSVEHHVAYSHPKKKLLVELHWCIPAAGYRFGFEELWQHRAQLTLYGQTLHTLDAETDLLMLVLHGAKHAWFRLKWLCDIQAILQTRELPWEPIFTRARAYGIEHMLVQALLLSHQLFETPLYNSFADPKALRIGTKLAQQAYVFILSAEEPKHAADHTWYFRSKRYQITLSSGSAVKLSAFIQRLRPIEDDFRRYHFTDRFFALYYVLRPVSVIARALRIGRKQGSDS